MHLPSAQPSLSEPPDVAGINQGSADGIHLDYKGVPIAVVSQIWSHRYWKSGLSGESQACDISVVRVVHRNADASVSNSAKTIAFRAPDVAGINQGSADGIHLDYKGVPIAVVSQIWSHRYWKSGLSGESQACDIGVARTVHRDTAT